MRRVDDACGDCSEAALPLELSRFRHFGDEWHHICQTLLSCERLLTVMSTERHSTTLTTDSDDSDDRIQLRQLIRSIEPKKYSKANQRRANQTRRSSYHRLKALTQLLMSSNLKRSTSLQSVPVVQSDDTDDTTATLPRLRRRPRINRFYHSLDVNDDREDDTNDDNIDDTKADDRTGLSLDLSSPSSQCVPTVVSRAQKQLNRHSCDVTSLLSAPQSLSQPSNRQILKYSKKRLRGPYGEMLESMMNTKNSSQEETEVKQNLSFIQELLRETEKQRKALDSSAKETTGTADTVTTTTTLLDDNQSIISTIGRHLDARTHIVGELYDTEKSFCEQLKDLNEKYSKPLLENGIIDQIFVQIVFGKVSAILEIHSKFLEALRHRITNWSRDSTVGDLFARFEDSQCADAYLAFVDNWFASKQLVKQLARDKPSFARFLVEQSREHRSKLSLDELMISIVQRIPRFELLLKQLLKNTCKEHEDHVLLEKALERIHALALNINRVKDENKSETTVLSSVSSLSSNQTIDLRTTERITSQQLREVFDSLPAEILDQELVLISSVTIRKRERVVLLFAEVLAIAAFKGRKKSEKFLENKYKVLNHFRLESLDLNTTSGFDDINSENCFQVLEKDLNTLEHIQNAFLTRLSQSSRHVLESVVQELALSLTKRMNELKERERNLEFIISSDDTKTTETTTSTTTSILVSFLSSEKRKSFENEFKALKEKKSQNSKLLPEFLCFLPIRKTRAGLQFTCASPTEGTRDVWICNSDGFVGQISVLSLNWTTETTLEPTIVSSNGVCNSKIICMTCVPKHAHNTCHALSSDSDDTLDDSEGDAETTARVSSKRSSLSSPTMWFGTDDSSVHIYSCFDAIRIKKNKAKVVLSAKVEAITYFSERVFVSLANHSVAIFDRSLTSGAWNTVPEVRENANCLRMCCVRNRFLWTSGHSSAVISVRDSDLRQLFSDIVVEDDRDDTSISNMTTVDDSCRVFVVIQSSLQIHCFSSEEPNFTHLQIISLQNTLQRALISCEEIIRQHKSACLKVSSLLAVKSQLWIGTSAGVILVLDGSSLELEIVPNGHTGHVRFLTCIRSERSLVVISGGDGLEQYSSSSSLSSSAVKRKKTLDESAENGREDSTNHLILFQIN